VIDPNHDSVNILLRELQSVDSVILAHRVESLEQAGKVLAESDINAIFIDPLSVGFSAEPQNFGTSRC